MKSKSTNRDYVFLPTYTASGTAGCTDLWATARPSNVGSSLFTLVETAKRASTDIRQDALPQRASKPYPLVKTVNQSVGLKPYDYCINGYTVCSGYFTLHNFQLNPFPQVKLGKM